jgi:Transcriptional Coactivator p15 (PC4)
MTMTVLAQRERVRNSFNSNTSPNSPTVFAVGDTQAIPVAEWPLNRRERVRITIDRYNGTWLFNARKWFEAEDGSIRPGKGIALGLKHLAKLAEATNEALAIALERGLVAPVSEDESRK